MSDFLKNLKSIFVEVDPNAPKAEPSAKTTPDQTSKSSTKPASKSEPPASTYKGELTGSVNERFTKVLLQSIEKNNKDGFDYLEYKNSLKSLSKMDMDEATRFKSAFAMAQTMGATPVNLIESAKFYQDILNKEKSKFDQAASQQIKIKVDGRKLEIKDLKGGISQKSKRITELEQEIIKEQARLHKLEGTIEIESNKVKQTQLDFFASFKNLSLQIQNDIDKMSKHLK